MMRCGRVVHVQQYRRPGVLAVWGWGCIGLDPYEGIIRPCLIVLVRGENLMPKCGKRKFNER